MDERLQKILSRAGVASRRAAERLIEEGRVTVNGTVVRELGSRADPLRDQIRVDGTRLRAAPEQVYLVLNKPRGVVCTRRDPGGRQTVMDLVPGVPGLFPVGRLDITTEGLILLTNDGAFAERVAHPRYETPRIYHAKVHGVPDAATLARLRQGVKVEGELLAADRVSLLSSTGNAWVELQLHEGKRHEVRRLLESVGHPVSKLKRVAIGPVTDRGLATGAFRALSEAERRALLGHRSAAAARPAPRRRLRREATQARPRTARVAPKRGRTRA